MSQTVKRNRQKWKSIIDAQACSGLSARKYCEQQSIGLASFYHWRQRLTNNEIAKREEKEVYSSFIDVGQFGDTVRKSIDVGKGIEVTLELTDGIRIVIRRG